MVEAREAFTEALNLIARGATWCEGIKQVCQNEVILGRHLMITVPGEALGDVQKEAIVKVFREFMADPVRITEPKKYVQGYEMKPCMVFYIEF